MTRISTLVHIALSVLALTACDGRSSRNHPAASFKVALLTPGPVSDQSWNGGAFQGLLRIRDSLGAVISHIQTKTPAEFEENFRQYGAQGFSLVFGHGFEFQDAAAHIAPQFPQTIFITTSGSTQGPNLAGMRFAFDEPAYLAGIITGVMTTTNLVGCIGGTELPPIKQSFGAFAAGARATNSKIHVVTAYIGNGGDSGAGKEQALALMSRGVDVIFQNADAAGLGVFQAARESHRALVFGSEFDPNTVAPEVTLGSVVIDLPHAFLSVARKIQGGHFKPRIISLGSASDVVRLVLNPVLAASIPSAVRAAVDSVQRGFVAGTAGIRFADSGLAAVH